MFSTPTQSLQSFVWAVRVRICFSLHSLPTDRRRASVCNVHCAQSKGQLPTHSDAIAFAIDLNIFTAD